MHRIRVRGRIKMQTDCVTIDWLTDQLVFMKKQDNGFDQIAL
jgi:hypothetical protein